MLGILVVSLLAVLAGCNAVLGIEEATVDEQAGQAMACELPDERILMRCEATADCERCLSLTCAAGEINGCVGDENCRKALVNYRICVGDDCTDDNRACGECLEASAAGCLATCAEDCRGGELWPLRELFCVCMEEKCPGKVPDCLQHHASTPDWELECLLTHCELATASEDHCLHATDGDPLRQCLTEPVVVPECPATMGLVGYGCEAPSDCCSRFCQHGTCAE